MTRKGTERENDAGRRREIHAGVHGGFELKDLVRQLKAGGKNVRLKKLFEELYRTSIWVSTYSDGCADYFRPEEMDAGDPSCLAQNLVSLRERCIDLMPLLLRLENFVRRLNKRLPPTYNVATEANRSPRKTKG